MDIQHYIYSLIVLNTEYILFGHFIFSLTPRGKYSYPVSVVLSSILGLLLYSLGVFNFLCSFLWCLSVLLIACKQNILEALRNSILTCLFLTSLDILMWTIIYVVPSTEGANPTRSQSIVPGLTGLLILIFVCFIIKRRNIKVGEYFHDMTAKENFLMIFALFSDLSLTSFMQGVYLDEMTPRLRKMMIVFCVIVLFTTIIVFFYLGFISKRDKYLKRIHDAEAIYFKNTKDAYDSLKKFRHDTKGHIQALTSLIENGETARASEYLAKLSERSGTKSLTFTGDSLIDALFYDVFKDILDDNVFHLQIFGKTYNLLDLDEFDKCVIFSNLFKNAREAIDKSSEKNLTIEIKENDLETCFEMINSKIQGIANIYTTDKSDKSLHGIGVSSIKDTVSKNGGEIEWIDEYSNMRVVLYLKSSDPND